MIEKFGDKFVLSENQIIQGSKSKIEIRCKKCGKTFVKIVNDFLRGSGRCPNCENKNKLYKCDFINKAKVYMVIGLVIV